MARPEVLRLLHNPPNPWRETRVDWLGAPPPARLSIYEDASKSILAENSSPDLGFRWSLNPYRGCYHGCAYCYARPSHQHLDFGAGTDFERKLTVKREAPTLLERAFEAAAWRGELIAFSGNTDCYQPLEAAHGLTRACLEVCRDYRNPVGVITKSALVERDLDVLAELSHVVVMISIPFLDADRARALEPYVPSPARRLAAIATLAAAGIPTGVMIAPIIPGLTDHEVPAILEAAREAGARFAGRILLRLPNEVRPVFEERLRAAFPDRAEHVLSAIADTRGGAMNDPRFFARMEGRGPRWAAIEALFDATKRRLGFERSPRVPDPSPFRRPRRGPQLELFGR